MKTLLQINASANITSTGRIAEEIGITALENGWKSFIAYGRDAGPSQSQLIKIGTKKDIFVHGLKSRLQDKHGLGSINATVKFTQIIKQINPDVIHLHNIHGYYLNYSILFKFLSTSKIPVVWTLHDCWTITGHCSYFDRVGCNKWKTLCHNCPLKTEYPASLFMDHSSQNYLLKKHLFNSIKELSIVTVSDWLGRIIKQSFLKNQSIQTIYNGIDTDVFKPKADAQFIRNKYKIGERFMLMSVATSWTNRKGLKDLIELSGLLKNDEVIVLVGLTNEQLNQIPPAMIGIARTESKQELASLYSAADLLISTSYEETFGLTIAESMACCTPAIVYNLTACPEVISESTGFIVTPKDYIAILSIIKSIKVKGKIEYTKACRERVLTSFKKESQYQKYITLYNSKIET